ncbi:MAG: nicotinate phosphoribosyltransferase, partial [Chloroflexi bacterium]|nr:nicotinate phosphoribosyltransferase [Chloroflexota bacterium]
APRPAAQRAETYLLNQQHLQTVIASTGARLAAAAAGRPVVDFGTRRAHGTDAALKAARALYIAGMTATSNVLAADRYGIPPTGTMAHSYVQAHDDEAEAFRSFVATHPETVLLVDTYDTAEGVRRVARLAAELGDAFRVHAVRLDSEPLGELAFEARAILDAAGLERVEIFASGGLDELRIAELVAAGAPIDAFGVGTRAAASADAPTLDAVYKLAAYAGRGRIKLSAAKETLPGRKQVFRLRDAAGLARGDVIARAAERLEGEPLLEQVMRGGERLEAGMRTLEDARERAAAERERLPAALRALEAPDVPYPVEVSTALRAEAEALRDELRRQPGAPS